MDDYDENDVLDLSESRARELTTLNLLSLLEAGEHYLIEAGYNPGEVPEFGTKEEDVWDRLHVIKDVLVDRFGIEHDLTEHAQTLERLDKETDGMQYAIDQLKTHRHAEKTGEPVRPF